MVEKSSEHAPELGSEHRVTKGKITYTFDLFYRWSPHQLIWNHALTEAAKVLQRTGNFNQSLNRV